ncbi:MAG: energy transducer TonB [Flavobacteriaceae bacterium]|nr:energy transducer TonB [Flavobacteriaceae bacterium]
MENKKHPKHRLEKNSGLYFVMGLTLVLALSYLALEWKTFEPDLAFFPELDEIESLDEIPPVTLIQPPPPPPPKILVPASFDIKEGDEQVVETVIESNEPDQDTEILPMQEVDFEAVEENPTVTWVTVEDAPVFPGCENASDKRACFQQQMQKHIRKVFRYPDPAQEMGMQGKVFVQFAILKDGQIGEIKLRGPHQVLEEEAARIISKLPQMTPGKQRGTPVKVPFAIPITFVLQ